MNIHDAFLGRSPSLERAESEWYEDMIRRHAFERESRDAWEALKIRIAELVSPSEKP